MIFHFTTFHFNGPRKLPTIPAWLFSAMILTQTMAHCDGHSEASEISALCEASCQANRRSRVGEENDWPTWWPRSGDPRQIGCSVQYVLRDEFEGSDWLLCRQTAGEHSSPLGVRTFLCTHWYRLYSKLCSPNIPTQYV